LFSYHKKLPSNSGGVQHGLFAFLLQHLNTSVTAVVGVRAAANAALAITNNQQVGYKIIRTGCCVVGDCPASCHQHEHQQRRSIFTATFKYLC
jgi:hypothetical protein